MRYSHQYKFVLISNWKCGCSSVANMFADYSEFNYHNSKLCEKKFGQPYHQVVHWPASKIKAQFKKNGWNWSKFIKITTVRNPWARVVSLYFYKHPKADKKNPKKVKQDFAKFVKTVLPGYQHGKRNRWNSYEMIHDAKGNKLVNHVIKLENLKPELQRIVKKHFPTIADKINYDLKRNVTQHRHYSYYYTKETRKLVEKMFSYDVQKFGYKFEKAPKVKKQVVKPVVFQVERPLSQREKFLASLLQDNDQEKIRLELQKRRAELERSVGWLF